MQSPPDLNVLPKLDIEDHVREAFIRPVTQARQIKLMAVFGRPGTRMTTYMCPRFFHGIHEYQGSINPRHCEIVIDCILDITVCLSSKDNRLGFHRLLGLRTR